MQTPRIDEVNLASALVDAIRYADSVSFYFVRPASIFIAPIMPPMTPPTAPNIKLPFIIGLNVKLLGAGTLKLINTST